ncbi:MAG: hypothetical protein WAX29_06770 [Propionibacterium sp.]
MAETLWVCEEVEVVGLAAAELSADASDATAVGEPPFPTGTACALLTDEEFALLAPKTLWIEVPEIIWVPVAAAPVEMPKHASEPNTATTPSPLMRVFGLNRREPRVRVDDSGLLGAGVFVTVVTPTDVTSEGVAARTRVGAQAEPALSAAIDVVLSCARAGSAPRVGTAPLPSEAVASISAAEVPAAARIGPRTRAGLAGPSCIPTRAGWGIA